MADVPEVERKEAEVSEEQEEAVPVAGLVAEVEEVVSADGEAVESASSESDVVADPPVAEEEVAADKEADDASHKNGDKNGVAESNGSSLELKRKSLVAEDAEVVVEEKKAKLAEETDAVGAAVAEDEADANGIVAN